MIMQRANPGLPIACVRRVEKTLTVRLPDDYVEFVLRHNGGTPANTWYRFRIGANILWVVGVSIHALDDSESNPLCLASSEFMRVQHDEYPAFPKGWLPIASDMADGEFFLCCVGEHYGQVWFQYSLPDDDGWWGSCVYCTQSFSDFLSRLLPRLDDTVEFTSLY